MFVLGSRCSGEVIDSRNSLNKGEIICSGEVATAETHPDVALLLEVRLPV